MNLNLFRKSNFNIVFPNNGDFDFANKLCTGCSIPNLSKNEIQLSKSGAIGYLTGRTITYGQIDMTFLLDEEYKIYDEMYKWFTEGNQIDIIVTLMSNRGKKFKEFQYVNVVPTIITNIDLNVTDESVEPIEFSVSCVMDRYEKR